MDDSVRLQEAVFVPLTSGTITAQLWPLNIFELLPSMPLLNMWQSVHAAPGMVCWFVTPMPPVPVSML
jgi:hypothetical protein